MSVPMIVRFYCQKCLSSADIDPNLQPVPECKKCRVKMVPVPGMTWTVKVPCDGCLPSSRP